MRTLDSVITDEELGAVPFVVIRRTWRQSQGEKELIDETQYETVGTVHPASPEELQLLPEEYRSEQILIFHSPVPISLGGPLTETTFTAPDRILYRFRQYLAVSVRDWTAFGFCRALAVLQREE